MLFFLTWTLVGATSTVSATVAITSQVDQPEQTEPLFGIKIHGFVSQGYIRSTSNNYLGKSTSGTFEFTEAGINFTKSLTDRLSTGIQFFARRLNQAGDFSAKFDWFYLEYRFADWLGLRAGRVKLPFGLYNESSDIDSARVAILLPQSVYPIQNRDFLLAQTGGEIFGYLPTDLVGAFEYRLYGGTIIFNEPSATSMFQNLQIGAPYLWGGRLLWETPIEGLRLAASAQWLRLDYGFSIPGLMGPSGLVEGKIPAQLYIASAEYAAGPLLVAAEASWWVVDTGISRPDLFPTLQQPRMDSARVYLLAAYQVAPWLSPGAYFSALFPNVDHLDTREGHQYDAAFTLRFDINDFWLLKLEGHYMHGTAVLTASMNGGTALDQLDRSWGLFLAKTTLHF